MKGKLFQKLIKVVGMLGITCIIACSSSQENVDYKRCNETSLGMMAEVENGFFFANDHFLYYADKDNMSVWVPVCNKPDCMHEDDTCNAYLESYNQITQKGNKLYGVSLDGGHVSGTLINLPPYVYEIATDGSGRRKVYDIMLPEWKDNDISCSSYATFPERVLVAGGYIDENGNYQYDIIRLEEDENGEAVTESLYHAENTWIMSAKMYYGMRGDDVIRAFATSKEEEKAFNTIAYADRETLEALNVTEEEMLIGAYISNDILTYYVQNEGFYTLDLLSGEKTLLLESQIKNGSGKRLTEDYFVERTFYDEKNPTEKIECKFYDGTKWLDISGIEELPNLKTKTTIDIRSVASDRVFFSYGVNTAGKRGLCYFMLGDDTPELIPCTEIGKEIEIEESSSEEDETSNGEIVNTDFEEMTIFDNEDGTLKVTGASHDGKDYVIDVFFEVGDSGRGYQVTVEALINGIQCHTNKSFGTLYPQEGEVTITFDEDTLKEYGVTDIYSIEEFTDIELIFYVNELENYKTGEEILKKSVHIYPQGEDAVVHYTREPQETDVVLVENEYTTVTLIGYETTKVTNDTPVLFIENKTEEDIQFDIKKASINDAQVNAIGMTGEEAIQGGACAIRKFILGDERFQVGEMGSFWEEYGITEVGKIQILVTMGYFDIGKYEKIGEHFVEGIYTLYPQGEEKAQHYVRQAQATDIVLVDNESIKLTLVGYEDWKEYATGNIIKNGNAKLLVENKTDEMIWIDMPVCADNGLSGGDESVCDILPKHCYTHIVNGTSTMITEVCKKEFLYRISDENGNVLNTEYVTLYPNGEENANLYVFDTENMEEILLDNEFVTLAFSEYQEAATEGILALLGARVGVCVANKTNQNIYFEISDILVNGISQKDSEGIKGIIFANGTAFRFISVGDGLETVEITFKAYAYNYQDGTFGEELGSQTVKFGPK